MTLFVCLLPDAWDEYQYWQGIDKKLVSKINRLVNETARTPYAGSGKPEPLKHDRAGWWSRRITNEHRLVYRVNDGRLEIAQCRYHH